MPKANRMPTPARLAALLASVACLILAPVASGARPFETAVTDGGPFNQPSEIPTAFQKVRASGTSAVRLYMKWRDIAPAGDRKPAGFDAANPAASAYDWSLLDYQVRIAKQNDLEPILSIWSAPDWAEGRGSGPPGTVRPKAREFGRFAKAAALRYSGRFHGLPRVRYWQAWNEPNLYHQLWPQYDTPSSEPVRPDSRLVSPNIYRRLVNALAKAVHRVNRDNLVIAGGLSPFGGESRNFHKARPLSFMRELLCMNERDRPKRGCRQRIRFDVWSHHPYTQGGPTHSALSPLDVSLGDLEEMRRLLNRAIRAGQITSKRRPLFWVTEFSWDTDPPDPAAVPMKLHKRWVAHALYRMWKNGISLVTWFQIKDMAPRADGLLNYESGLYFHCDGGITCAKPKPSLQAFRFPFVAFRSRTDVRVWGRTPFGLPGRVSIEQRRSGRWRRVAVLRANRHGIFRDRLRARRRGTMRARLFRDGKDTSSGVRRSDASVPFSLRRVPDRDFRPFGS